MRLEKRKPKSENLGHLMMKGNKIFSGKNIENRRRDTSLIDHTEKKVNLFIKKNIDFIFMSGDRTSLDIKLLNSLFYNSIVSQKEKGLYKIETEKLKNIVGSTSSDAFIYNKLSSLKDKEYILNYKSLAKRKNTARNIKPTGIIKSIAREDGCIKYSFHENVEKLFKRPEFYVTIQLENTTKLKRLRSVALYEFIKSSHIQAKGAGETKEIKISDLKNILGMKKTQYSAYDFQKYVMKPALEEIKALTDIDVTYSKIKERQKITGFKFFSKTKEEEAYMEKKEVKETDITETYLEKYPAKCRKIAGMILAKDGKNILEDIWNYSLERNPDNLGGYMHHIWKTWRKGEKEGVQVKDNTAAQIEKQLEEDLQKTEAYKQELLEMDLEKLKGLAEEKKKVGTRLIPNDIIASNIYKIRMAEHEKNKKIEMCVT